MILPKGTTGFWRGNDKPPLVDVSLFLATCHHVARAIQGQVAGSDVRSRPARNFHSATIATRDRHINVLCNIHFPLVAFSLGSPDDWDLGFTDEPRMAVIFSANKVFTVLSAAEASSPFSPEQLQDLAECEQEMVAHWSPKNLGSIVFNRWD